MTHTLQAHGPKTGIGHLGRIERGRG